MIDLIAFGERLKEMYEEKGAGIKQLADAANVHRSAAYRYIKGENLPALDTVSKIADYFDCSLDFLVGTENENYKTNFCRRPPFAEQLKKLLDEYKVTKYRLVKDTGLPESAVYSWQTGESEPTVESVIKIAEYLGCTVDHVVGRA